MYKLVMDNQYFYFKKFKPINFNDFIDCLKMRATYIFSDILEPKNYLFLKFIVAFFCF